MFDKPTDFDTWDRCITRGLPPSMFPFNYNNGIEIHQAPGYVIVRLEMIHEARIDSRRRAAAARSRDQAVDGRVARPLRRQHARRRDHELQRHRRHDERRHSGLAARRYADDDEHEDHGALHAHGRRHDPIRDARRGSRGADAAVDGALSDAARRQLSVLRVRVPRGQHRGSQFHRHVALRARAGGERDNEHARRAPARAGISGSARRPVFSPLRRSRALRSPSR